MEIMFRQENPTRIELQAEGFPEWEVLPHRLLRARVSDPDAAGMDSVMLLDFSDDLSAYIAFQELGSNPDDFMEGFAVRENRVYFRRGHWIGVSGLWSWKGMLPLENNLSVPGTPAGDPNLLPTEFSSLIHQGRIEGSERILTHEFLGLPVSGRVFAVRVDCQGDTAWVYASAHLGRDFGFKIAKTFKGSIDTSGIPLKISVRATGFLPLELHFSSAGMVGVEGCFDDSLTNFWIKMQARPLKNLK